MKTQKMFIGKKINFNDKNRSAIFKIIFLLIFVFSAFPVLAADGNELQSKPQDSRKIDEEASFSVRIDGAEISSQDGNNFEIKFNLRNYSKNFVQPGVHYGIFLVKERNGIQTEADRKIYEENLSINPEEEISRTINYQAPSYFDGECSLFFQAYADDGEYSESIVFLGKYVFSGSGAKIDIDYESCHVSAGEKIFKQHELVETHANDLIVINCKAKNNSGDYLEVYPLARIYNRLDMGIGSFIFDVKSEKNVFNPDEEKEVEVKFPASEKIQFSKAFFSLADEKRQLLCGSFKTSIKASEKTFLIKNIKLNKDYFESGDRAEINVNLKNRNQLADKSKLIISIFDRDKNACIQPDFFEEEIEKFDKDNTMKMSLQISNECVDPIINVSIKDSSGKILDETSVSVEGRSAEAQKAKEKIEKDKNFSRKRNTIILMFFALLFFAAVISKVATKLKYKNYIFPLFLLVFGWGMFLLPKQASAYSIYMGSISTNKPFYVLPDDGLNMTISGSINYDIFASGPFFGTQYVTFEVRNNGGSWTKIIDNKPVNPGDIATGSGTFSLPQNSGNYWIDVNIYVGGSLTETRWTTYGVGERGVCGSWNGKPYSGTPFFPNEITVPTSAWCAFGTWYGVEDTPAVNANYDGRIIWNCKGEPASLSGVSCSTSATALISGQCGDYNGKPVCGTDPLYSNIRGEGHGCYTDGWRLGSLAFKNLSGSGPFTWTCKGFGTSDANCSSGTPGWAVCGSATSNPASATQPTSNLCSSGTAVGIYAGGTLVNPTWNWVCDSGQPDEYGCDVSCSAPRIVPATCSGASSFYQRNDIFSGGCNSGWVTGNVITGTGDRNNPWKWTCTNAAGTSGECNGYVYPSINFSINGLSLSAQITQGNANPNSFKWTIVNASTAADGCTASCAPISGTFSETCSLTSPLWSGNKAHDDGVLNEQSEVITSAIGKIIRYTLICKNAAGGYSSSSIDATVVNNISSVACGPASTKIYCVAPDSSDLCVNNTNIPVVDSSDSSKFKWTCIGPGGNINCLANKHCSADDVWREIEL